MLPQHPRFRALLILLPMALWGCSNVAEEGLGPYSRRTDDGGIHVDPPTPGGGDGGVPILPDDAGIPMVPDDGGIPMPAPSVPSACDDVSTGRSWVVATDGDDRGDGSEASPLYTIQLAVDRARPGDEILLREGRYGAERAVPYAFGNCGGDVRYALIALKTISDYCTADRDRHQYDPADGESGSPITLRSYPGEHAILDGSGLSQTIHVSKRSHWRFMDLEIVGAHVEISGGNRSGNAHDISICDNEIHAMRLNDARNPAKANVGLIRIDRGDWGGADRIFIEGNELYDLAERNAEWNNSESRHIAAITTLSCLPYIDPECGGTRSVYIRDNLIHDVPSPFFFKNAAPGPTEIVGNIIYNAQRMGNVHNSNGLFERNLVVGVGSGFDVGGGSVDDADIVEHAGRNWTFRYNTVVGMSTFASIWNYGPHAFERNLFFGLNTDESRANYDTGALIRKSPHALQDEPTIYDSVDPRGSILQTVTSNWNCMVAPRTNYAHAKRILPAAAHGGSSSILEHYTLEEARGVFGWDQQSVRIVETSLEAVFVDPDGEDFAVLPGHDCAGMGAFAPMTP